MSQKERINVLLPVGRLVGSNMYDPKMTNYDGSPRIFKEGPDAGKPNPDYGCSIAIPKTPGVTHWGNEPWGQQIWNKGHADFPQGQASGQAFSWKITDGDSTALNKAQKRPCDNPNYRGCWVIHIASNTPPKIVNKDGSAYILEKNAVKPGYYVQANISVRGNDKPANPGVYVGLNAISLQAFGEEIVFGPDPSAMGFGQNVALPAGASAVPVGYGAPGAAVPNAQPAIPGAVGAPAAVPGSVPATPSVPGAAPAAPVGNPVAPAAPMPATPNPGFVQGAITPPATATPIAPGIPPAAPAAPVAAQPMLVMTAKAGGQTADAFRAAGWKDADMVAQGYAVYQ